MVTVTYAPVGQRPGVVTPSGGSPVELVSEEPIASSYGRSRFWITLVNPHASRPQIAWGTGGKGPWPPFRVQSHIIGHVL